MRRRALWAAFAALCGLTGCNAVFGWDQASLGAGAGGSSGLSGPGGGAGSPGKTTSADVCETYCAAVEGACQGPLTQYGTHEVCLAMCANIEPGFAGEGSADSIACRQAEAELAQGDPGAHCQSAGPLGGDACGGDPCEPYCIEVMALCSTQPSPPYQSQAECRSACATFPRDPNPGALGLQTGNTLNCRLYHLENAYNNNAMHHCPHTALESETCN